MGFSGSPSDHEMSPSMFALVYIRILPIGFASLQNPGEYEHLPIFHTKDERTQTTVNLNKCWLLLSLLLSSYMSEALEIVLVNQQHQHHLGNCQKSLRITGLKARSRV
jgi:hypothetical protein